ncbi:hypothetical protein PoMZ_01635 [Pyricularia oryzae]|uniref:Uncharacterized protein n=1 Tax=Pyricularia oryzae TaxID=318829 RepID=A0A4P7N9B1_PYROR|nr:hypothetical protein PoMZ_01635 [Pyricularia oryzae]
MARSEQILVFFLGKRRLLPRWPVRSQRESNRRPAEIIVLFSEFKRCMQLYGSENDKYTSQKSLAHVGFTLSGICFDPKVNFVIFGTFASERAHE